MTRSCLSAVVFVAIVALCVILLFPCIQTVRVNEGWQYSLHNARQIAMALHSYHEVYDQFPPAVVQDKDGRPLYSWRVVILPFLEQAHLYNQFRLDEPWDSPHNKPLSETAPMCYLSSRSSGDENGMTHYQAITGPGTAFERPGLTWNDFPDGLDKTLLVMEVREPVLWTKPIDVVYDPNGPLPDLGIGFSKPVHFLCREVGRRPGFSACFADGTARFIRSTTEQHILRALMTRNGGEKVKDSWLE